jgi:hypothetical protein
METFSKQKGVTKQTEGHSGTRCLFRQKTFGDLQTLGSRSAGVLGFMEYGRATISSIDHMIDKSRLLPAWDSRHAQPL